MTNRVADAGSRQRRPGLDRDQGRPNLYHARAKAFLKPERDAAGYKGVVLGIESGYGPVRDARLHLARRDADILRRLLGLPDGPARRAQAQDRPLHAPLPGPPDGAITIVEFADMECGYCKYRGLQMDALLEANAKTLSYKRYYKFFPLWFNHAWAMKAASAADCLFRFAEAQAMFPFKKHVYAQQATMTVSSIDELAFTEAEAAGIPKRDFLGCYLRDESLADVRKDIEEGQRLGVKSTPTYFIDGTEITWIEDTVMEDFLRTRILAEDDRLRAEALLSQSAPAGGRATARTGSGSTIHVRTARPALRAGSKVHFADGVARRPRSARPAAPREHLHLERRAALRDQHAEHDDSADARVQRERRDRRLHDLRDPRRRVHVLQRDERALAQGRPRRAAPAPARPAPRSAHRGASAVGSGGGAGAAGDSVGVGLEAPRLAAAAHRRRRGCRGVRPRGARRARCICASSFWTSTREAPRDLVAELRLRHGVVGPAGVARSSGSNVGVGGGAPSRGARERARRRPGAGAATTKMPPATAPRRRCQRDPASASGRAAARLPDAAARRPTARAASGGAERAARAGRGGGRRRAGRPRGTVRRRTRACAPASRPRSRP